MVGFWVLAGVLAVVVGALVVAVAVTEPVDDGSDSREELEDRRRDEPGRLDGGPVRDVGKDLDA